MQPFQPQRFFNHFIVLVKMFLVTGQMIGEQIRLSNGESGYIICHSLITKKWNEDRDYLYPVPISERTLSNGVITQNPGWNDGLNFN